MNIVHIDERTIQRDLLAIVDKIDEFQKKYKGIYVTAGHCGSDFENASATVSEDEEVFKSIVKDKEGTYHFFGWTTGYFTRPGV